MMALRQRRGMILAVAAATAFAWIFGSNHCAIAGWTMMPQSFAHADCCHEGDRDKDAPRQSTKCCEAFNVPLPGHAVAPLVQLHELQPAWLEAPACKEPAEINPAANGAVHATGPPGARSFSELVLNRSLLSHAPPVFVA